MGDAHFSIFSKVYAYTDVTASNAPVRKAFDWTRSFQGVPVRNPRSSSLSLEAGTSQSVFSGSRTTSINGTTNFAVTVSPIDNTVYRFTWAAAGANPAFRTPRSLTPAGATITVTRNANLTATFVSSVTLFGAVQVGDTVFVPGISTGDGSGPFSTMNEGFWTVLSVSGTQLVLARLAQCVFSAASEVVNVTNNAQLQAFSQAGVQVGDQVQISAGFSTITQRGFVVRAVTPTWFEVLSSQPLPAETAVPGVAGIAFYSSAKRWLRIESDQPVVVQLNGSTDTNTPMISPLTSDQQDQVGWFEFFGTTFSLTILNKSLVLANVEVFSAE